MGSAGTTDDGIYLSMGPPSVADTTTIIAITMLDMAQAICRSSIVVGISGVDECRPNGEI